MHSDLSYNPLQESTEVIKKVHQLTAHYWLKTKLSNGLLILAEIVCYLLAIGLVVFAILLPNGTINVTEEISNNIEVGAFVKIKEIIYFFMILKVAIGVLGILMIVPAVLFRKVRKKNYVLEEVNGITGEYLEKSS